MKLLIVSTDWSGLVRPIVNELKRQGHEVDYLDHSFLSHFSYFNKFDRFQSKISDLFYKEKYKKLRTNEQILCTLKGYLHNKKYDKAIFTNPNIFNETHFAMFRQHVDCLVLNLWDSLKRMPDNRDKIRFFDKIFSFDFYEAKQFGFEKSSNYFSLDEEMMPVYDDYEFDVFCIMSFDKERYRVIDKFINENKNLKLNIIFYIDRPRKKKYIKNERIAIVDKPLFNDELKDKVKHSKSILDVGYKSQKGLSFRIFEGLAWEKKVITTNDVVKNYDFFNSNNIYILNETMKVDDSFLASTYEKIDENIKNYYRLDNWVSRLIG